MFPKIRKHYPEHKLEKLSLSNCPEPEYKIAIKKSKQDLKIIKQLKKDVNKQAQNQSRKGRKINLTHQKYADTNFSTATGASNRLNDSTEPAPNRKILLQTDTNWHSVRPQPAEMSSFANQYNKFKNQMNLGMAYVE